VTRASLALAVALTPPAWLLPVWLGERRGDWRWLWLAAATVPLLELAWSWHRRMMSCR
jgi:hypothetical protein